jgi:hypothetical protein
LESDNFPNKKTVVKAYVDHPFPDKYNKHTVGKESFDPNSIILTDNLLMKAGYLKDTLKTKMQILKAIGSLKKLKFVKKDSSMALILPSEGEEQMLKLNTFISQTQLAKQLVAKWFNRTPEGKMDYEMIKDRGLYSASEADKALAQNSASAVDYLFDEELIGNTFVVFNKLNFYPNEPVAKLLLGQALIQAEKISLDMAKQKAIKVAQAGYEQAKEGYTVITNSFLYKLDWNPDIAAKFRSYFLSDKINPITAWDTTQLFKLTFVGDEISSSLVTFSLKETRTEEQVINLSVNRNIDNVFAKLQKKYEVFRPVTPINSVGPLTARIGLKEGIEQGQSFEILESAKDKKTGAYKYSSIGTCKVSKDLPVWDNRFGAAENPALDEQGKPIVTPEFTTFSKGDKAELGMHFLRLKK